MSERMTEAEFNSLLIRRVNRDGTAERLCSVAHAEITALRAEVVQASQQLGDILAIIHRDGGHHTADVGIEQSVKDAHIKWANLMTENERLRAALEPLACTCDRPNGAACSRSEVDCPFWNARAALEEKQ